MYHRMFQMSGALMSVLTRIIKANIIVEGLENIPDRPCLFVVNHFTRIETLLIPYVLFKDKEMKVRSLASATLFNGIFGKYLESMGTVSKREPGRNRMIIHDLLTGESNWVIYPEGLMVKNKKVFEKGKYRLNAPTWKGPPHTGAAVLSIKAEIIRHDCLKAISDGDHNQVNDEAVRYNLWPLTDISALGSVIVPVNITYYPLRPGQNFLSDIAGLFFRELPARVNEELQTEGKILLTDSDINIHFGKPIDVMSEVESAVNLGDKYFPFVAKKKRDDLITAWKGKKITQYAMRGIYTSTSVHIDHLFCTALRKSHSARIHRKDFARALYLSALEVGEVDQRRTHPTLERDLIKCIVDEDYSPLESVCKLTEDVGALVREGEDYIINVEAITGDDYPFHDIRITNAATVIANELEPLNKVVDSIERNINLNVNELKGRLASTLHERNLREYRNDYDKHYDSELSKDRSVGEPIFLHKKDNQSGIVLVHGYLSAPEEMRPLAEHLYDKGYSVYVPCLKGMGTAPQQLKDVTFEDWIYSVDKAYAVIRNSCRDVYAGGFSAGSLLALVSAARKQNAIKALFVVNAPIYLKSIRSRFIPGIVSWNEFTEKVRVGELKRLEYVENESEDPQVNYCRNYTQSVLELKHLIKTCTDAIPEISSPLLVIQGDNDPVVKSESAEYVYEKTSSAIKELQAFKRENHIIIKNEGCEEIFDRISMFLDSCK